jgi:hypothetical protein
MLELHEYLILVVINGFVCLGAYSICNYEINVDTRKPTKSMLFWWVKFYGEKRFPVLIKPICGCLVCMSSVHSIYLFFWFHDFTAMSIVVWVVYVLCLAGFNTVLNRFVF